MTKNSWITLTVLLLIALIYLFDIRFDDGTHKVLAVHDGDTIEVDMFGDVKTIRFIGVDTPETHHPSKPIQCFGPEASDFTTESLAGEYVRLEADPLSGNTDKYDRLLRFVYLSDEDFNRKLIAQGYGFAVTGFEHTKMDEYIRAQNEAEQSGAGLYSACDINYEAGYASTNPRTSP